MSGRLFDVPFQNYEAAPLRRRENDSFASPSRHFTMQDAADFSTMRRRKRDDQWIVKMAMRAVLLSPVIVLVIWSIASVAFAHRQIQQNNNYSSSSQRMQQTSSRRQWLFPRRMYQQNLGSPLIVQPKNFPNQRMTNNYNNINKNNNDNSIEAPIVVPVMPAGQYYDNGQPLIQLPPQQQQQQLPEQGAQYYYQFPPEQARQRGVPLQDLPEQQAQYYYEFPEQQQEDPRAVALELPEQQAKQYYYEFPQEAIGENPGIPDAPMQAAAPPAMGRAQRHSNLRPSNHEGTKRNNKVLHYYYNPKDTVRDKNGNLFLPSVVYDSNGRPIELQSLHANQVLIEPPSSMIHHNISANVTILNITYHHPDTFDGRVYDKKREMAMPDWGQSTKTDSSIILCTVGVMALLVGAVSARNMRSRSFLSVCIENEALEDDAAYDTAYTVTNNHYNTFAQGWKGDLEKFDV